MTLTSELRRAQAHLEQVLEWLHPVPGAIIGEAIDRLQRVRLDMGDLAARCEGKVLVKPYVDIPCPWQQRPLPYHAQFPCAEAWGQTEAEAVERFQAELDRIAARVKALRDEEVQL